MIINTSRYLVARKCWRLLFNQNHRRLTEGKAWALIDGGAFHEGVATGLATGNWDSAVSDALKNFDQTQADNPFAAYEFGVVEQHRQVVEKMVRLYEREYEYGKWQVLQPELTFTYDIPDSEHDCVFVPENGLYAEDFASQQRVADKILAGLWTPKKTVRRNHQLTGRCDAIVQRDGGIWLFEHKTTSVMNEGFWMQWGMDIQPRAYLWAVWKMFGVMPKGFVLNAVFKPSERQLAQWNAKRTGANVKGVEDYMKFEAREYPVSQSEIRAVERKFRDLGDEWERRMLEGKFPESDIRTTCFSYNRRCSFADMCSTQDDPNSFEHMELRAPDYVETRLYQLEGVTTPSKETVQEADE